VSSEVLPGPALAGPGTGGDVASDRVVVVIDDDHAMRLSCRQILARMGFAVEVFDNGAAGLEGVARLKPPLVVVDLKMPGMSGLEVITRVHELDPETVIIVITGYATIATAVDAMKSGAYDFLPKPFSPDELRLIVGRGMERRRLQQESRHFQIERELLRHRFVTFVSHQLKAPLVAIHQYLDVLKRLGDAPEAAEHRAEWLDRCLKRAEDMQALIHDWLTLAQIEGGALARRHEPLDVAAVLVPIPDTYQPMAAAAQLGFECEPPPAGLNVIGDASAIAVLLDNLITNAIKYNRPGGSVHVSARSGAGEVCIIVRDTGLGIPAECLPFVFDEFFRVGGAGEGKHIAGTGLGLPICKRIAAEMGGTIEVQSKLGQGSTFTVRLPAGSATAIQTGVQV
jgi:signal transduction histidine kinase